MGLVGAGLLGACIVADPLPEQRSLPARRPSIEGTNPPATKVLTQLTNTTLSVRVRLYNPALSFQWRVFVDWDPVLNPQQIVAFGPSGARSFADLQIVEFEMPRDTVDLNVCHTIEFVTAIEFHPTSAHAAVDGRGASSISWTYVPMGDYSKCSGYDGGATDGGFFDAGSDASSDAMTP
ncbi:hypothetical protein [Pendulispora albinea]|uniref:Uncharacterized protein n=1 Tax=Pendulispora albinea TaxID=2741071 RepID=A0ABZ2M9D2_9BACT